MPVDANLFKQVMRRFATGVMVLTVVAPEGMHAVTMNGVTSLSLDPVLMLVCIEKNARSHGLVRAARAFVLNILSAAQSELGQIFAYDRAARQHPADLVQGHIGATGALIFDEALGYLECRLTAEYAGGDHTIFVAEVVAANVNAVADEPLIYYGGKWLTLRESGTAPSGAAAT
jgi:flavin reductase (DIM6/NTAB) family NADH-FMN oxidoreductase RutF